MLHPYFYKTPSFFSYFVLRILRTAYTRLKQTENEKLSAQIASIKSQINPHFLFNTLNNIYATAIDTSPKTADIIDKLSEMMRYTMKDTRQDFVLLYVGNCRPGYCCPGLFFDL